MKGHGTGPRRRILIVDGYNVINVRKPVRESRQLEDARLIQRATAQPEPEEAEENAAVEDTAYFQTRQRILELLSSLTETDAKILTLRFGLEKELPLSPEETGKRLGMTPQEVLEREAGALARLRREG